MSNRPNKRRLHRIPSKSGVVSLDDLIGRDSKTFAVTLKDREGVFVHKFKCGRCNLEFTIYSWLADRHRLDTVVCPECRKRPMTHWRAIVSETTEFGQQPEQEICAISSWPGAELVESDLSATTWQAPLVNPQQEDQGA